MYALIECGGQQHKVELGRYITVRRLAIDEGAPVVFDRVLLGTPVVEGAVVYGRIRRHLRGPKTEAFTYQAKKGHQRHWGFRDELTQVTVEKIEFGGETFQAEGLEEVDSDEAVEAAVGAVDDAGGEEA
ncbi:MAG: 50S ribosomal protein L21 [Armatimonadetes bacterium]|nr:50S ribosomal protein L21 [Armatimonadota bacterium]